MATTSYGSITIVDITDVGEFSVYPKIQGSKNQIYNVDTGTPTPDWQTNNIIIDPVAYYGGTPVTNTVTSYTWTRRDGAGAETPLLTGETAQLDKLQDHYGRLTINNNMLTLNNSSGLITYILTARYVVDGITLTAVGEADFALIKQGSNAKTAKITGRNTFKYNTEGALTPTGDTIVLTGEVTNTSITGWYYRNSNGTYVTTGAGSGTTIRINPSDNTISYGTNYVNTTSAITDLFNNDVATLKLITSDNDTYDIFSITKLRDGAAGSSVTTAVLTNDDQMIPFDSAGTTGDFTSAISQVKIYVGGIQQTSGWTINQTLDSVSATPSTTSITNDTVTVTAFSGTATTGNVTFTCTGTVNGQSVTLTKTFSLIKITSGTPGVSPTIYSIEPSVYTLVKAENNTFEPTAVTFNAYTQTGTNKQAYDGRIQFFNSSGTLMNETGSTAGTPEDTTNRSSRTFTPPAAWVDTITAKLYAANASISGNNPLDTQTVVITFNGKKGQDGQQGPVGPGALQVVISNEAEVIPCTSGNNPIPNGSGDDSNKFIISTNFDGYQGVTKKFTTVSATAFSPISGNNIIASTTSATTSASGSITYKLPNTITIGQEGILTFTFNIYSGADATTTLLGTITKVYSWTRSNAVDAPIFLLLDTPEGTIFEKNGTTASPAYVRAILNLIEGSTTLNSNVTYKWYKTTTTPYDTEVTSTTDTDPLYKNGNALYIKPNAIDGYGTFKGTTTYGGETYTQYVSVIDKTDPLQVSVHSTIGLQIKNSLGTGAIYARVTQDGDEIDEVPEDIEAGTSYPTTGLIENMQFVKLSTEEHKYERTARLMQYNGSTWEPAVPARICNYEWTFRDENNNVITDSTKVPYQDSSTKTNNQFIYIDASLINSKITADVQVTKA